MFKTAYIACSLILFLSSSVLAAKPIYSEPPFKPHVITSGLEHPWGMAFISKDKILVTERPGRLRVINNGKLDSKPISGLPEIAAKGQGGLLDIALHPDFIQNGWIYLSYAGAGQGGIGTEVVRGRLKNHQFVDQQTIFVLKPKTNSGHHFGSRLAFDKEGYLYISVGDRGDRPRAQNINDHAGSIIRLHDDGAIPEDNPFVDREGHDEIYSFGHRNRIGMGFHHLAMS